MDYENLINSRKILIRKAVADVEKWCAPSLTRVGRKHPDTFWIELFDPANSSEITKDDAHLFLTSFQLTNRVIWNKKAVAALMGKVRSHSTFKPIEDIPTLADQLRQCSRDTRQTSAAS